jgi:hypothetical protein
LESKIHHVTPAQCKILDKSFQYRMRQLLQAVRTKAAGPSTIFAEQLAQMKTASDDQTYWAANMEADKQPQFPNPLSNAETAGTTWSLADM